MLAAIAEEHPVILVVDDLHLADDVSLAVLHLVMRRSRGQPIMVVLIARPGELPQSPQAERLRGAAVALGIREMEISPLTEEESLELLHLLIPSDQPRPGPGIRRALLGAAAGYPMVLELLVQDWQASGERSLALSVEAMTADPGSGGPAPAVYRDILDRITRSLDPTTRNVLNLASLLGQRLNDTTMFGLVDLSVGQTVSALAELVRRRVLRDGARGLEFVNELLRAAAYVGVPITLRRVLHGKITDRLMLEHERGSKDLGLEIAWHCIRAGRTHEATSHLLRGAGEAIRLGLPFGAERGLSTALPQLTEPARSEALMLLAEALQEQSKWNESLLYIDQVRSDQPSSSTDLALLLKTKAKHRLGILTPRELAELPQVLLTFIDSGVDEPSRIQAALVAASIVNATRNRTLTPFLLERMSSLSGDNLQLDEKSDLLLAKSMLFYNIRDFSSSLACIREAMSLLEERQAANSVLGMLHNGVGAIISRQGDYSGSLPSLRRSYEIGLRIGNDTIYLQAAANLSLCFERLGEYETAISWANLALGQAEDGYGLPWCLQASQSSLLSYAMLGRSNEAEQTIRQYCDRLARAPTPAVRQAWALYSADALRMLERPNEAMTEGHRAITDENGRLHSDFCVGPYARWVALIGVLQREVTQTHDKLDSLIHRLDDFDNLDQAEILNAKNWLCSRSSMISSHLVEDMFRRLETLPPAVTHQLRRIGMLDFC
jgi:tetratricopeptide (TPR) repeat protein